MSLLQYKDSFPWAVSIKSQVLSLSMPPWFADERYGTFRHSSSLTATEVDTIVDWCLGGAPEGEPRRCGHSTGTARRDGARFVARDSGDLRPRGGGWWKRATRRFSKPGLRRKRILRSIEFRPERPTVVRSALFFVVPKGKKAGAPVASWIAGEGAEVWPEGTGVRVPAERVPLDPDSLQEDLARGRKGNSGPERGRTLLRREGSTYRKRCRWVERGLLGSARRRGALGSALNRCRGRVASGGGRSSRRNHASANPPSHPRPGVAADVLVRGARPASEGEPPSCHEDPIQRARLLFSFQYRTQLI